MEELTKELSRIQEECDALRMKLKASRSKVFSSHEKKTIHKITNYKLQTTSKLKEFSSHEKKTIHKITNYKLQTTSKLKVFSSHEKKTIHKITQTRGLQA